MESGYGRWEHAGSVFKRHPDFNQKFRLSKPEFATGRITKWTKFANEDGEKSPHPSGTGLGGKRTLKKRSPRASNVMGLRSPTGGCQKNIVGPIQGAIWSARQLSPFNYLLLHWS